MERKTLLIWIMLLICVPLLPLSNARGITWNTYSMNVDTGIGAIAVYEDCVTAAVGYAGPLPSGHYLTVEKIHSGIEHDLVHPTAWDMVYPYRYTYYVTFPITDGEGEYIFREYEDGNEIRAATDTLTSISLLPLAQNACYWIEPGADVGHINFHAEWDPVPGAAAYRVFALGNDASGDRKIIMAAGPFGANEYHLYNTPTPSFTNLEVRIGAFDSLKGWDNISVTDPISCVPEPSTMLLFGSGLVGLIGLGRKKFLKD